MNSTATAIAIATLIVWVATPARAGCGKDTDCKGDRICVDGQCVSPSDPSTAPFAGNYKPDPTRSPSGWSVGAAVLGYISSALVLGLFTGAAAADDDDVAAINGPVGAVLLIAMGPTTHSGSTSARAGTPVWGCTGCRIAGWVLYGLSVASSASMAVIGFGLEEDPNPFQIGFTGLVGATSLILFASDSLVSRSQAYDYFQGTYEADLEVEQEVRQAITWAPVIVPIRTPEGDPGATFGVVGAF